MRSVSVGWPASSYSASAVEQRPAVIGALKREAAATQQLDAEGMIFTLQPV